MCLCMCLHASVHKLIVCVVHSQKVAAAVTALKQSSILTKGKGGSGRTPGSVRSMQSRRKFLGASPRKNWDFRPSCTDHFSKIITSSL